MKRVAPQRRLVPPGLASLLLSIGLLSAAFGHGDHTHEPARPGLIGQADRLQREHRFAEALVRLETLLENQPAHAEAWLMKSTIHAVRGEHEAAYAAALPLFGFASPLVAATAAANALSLSGKAEASYDLLASRVAKAGDDRAEVRCWAHATLAEIAQRLGRVDAARRHLEAALEACPDSTHTRVCFGEFLIDQGDAAAAWRLLWRSSKTEAEQVVVALAAKALGKKVSFQPEPESASRSAARYYLDLAGDAQRAWEIAKANWDGFEREPADTLLAMRAGRAANADVGEIESWIAATRLEDVRLKTAR